MAPLSELEKGREMCLSITTQGNKERVAKEGGAAKKVKKAKRDKRRVNNK